MKILLIENDLLTQDYIKSNLESKLRTGSLFTLKTDLFIKPIDNIARHIALNYSDFDLFVLNVDLNISGSESNNCAGLKLFKFLRLYNFRQHFILYSHFNKEQMMDLSSTNHIIFSRGISFVNLPFEFSSLDINSLAKDLAPEDLSSFFKSEYNLPDNRHFMANWWGVFQLWNVQKAVEANNEDFETIDFEQCFSHSIKELFSFQGLMAVYLNRISTEDINSELLRSRKIRKDKDFQTIFQTKEKTEDDINRLRSEIAELLNKKMLLESVKTGTEDDILDKLNSIFPDKIDKDLKKLNKTILKRERQIDKQLAYKDFLCEQELNRNEIESLIRVKNHEIDVLTERLEKELCFSNDDFSLEKIQNELKESSPKIVYVDDQAEEGWSFVLQRMIYGKQPSDSFISIVPHADDNIEQIVDKILLHIRDTKLLILDLRLKNEIGNSQPISEYSGFKVLKRLKEESISCPILIMSASNKLHSLKKSLSLGAVAFWTKEGLDLSTNAESAVENYLKLNDLIYSLIKNFKVFEIVSCLNIAINKIQNSSALFWWEERFWPETEQKTKMVKRHKVCTVLKHVIDVVDSLISHTFINEDVLINKYFYPIIIARCSIVMELIHENDFIPNTPPRALSEKLKAQLGQEAFLRCQDLLKSRNTSVHKFESIDVKDLEKFILDFINYVLFFDPPNLAPIQPSLSIFDRLRKGESVNVTVCRVLSEKNMVYLDFGSAVTASVFTKNLQGLPYFENAENIKVGSVLNVSANTSPNNHKVNIVERDGLFYTVYPAGRENLRLLVNGVVQF